MILQSFEGESLEGIKFEDSSAVIDTTHKKDGISSLRWEMEGDASLALYGDVGCHPFQEGGPDQNRDNFIFWIYQEEKGGQPLKVDFYKDKRWCCGFEFGTGFTGWRTCWVPYEDMDGTPETDMDEIRLTRKGDRPTRLWIDQVISSVPVDPRHPVRDAQVPFVNRKADTAANAHWMSLYRYACLKQEKLSGGYGHVTEGEKGDITRIETRLEQVLLSSSPWPRKGSLVISDDEYKELLEQFKQFKLAEREGYVTGVTIDAACQKAAYPREERARLIKLTGSVDIKVCGQVMAEAAYAWHVVKEGQKELLENMFLLLFRHLLNQGWAAGSGMGTTHHLGYPMRSLYTALFLMRDCLRNAGLLDQAADMMAWYTGQGRIFREDREMVGESMDTLNTLLQGILESILMQSSTELVHVCLKAFSHSFGLSFLPAPGLRGPFKEDGSVFHHCSHYPAYAMGGFKGAAPVVYCLSGTAYRMSQAAHESIRTCLLATRLYCNRYHWLVSMSSRHPKGVGEMSQISSLEPYYYLALAGTPDGLEPVDREMAGALLRLAEYVDFGPADRLRREGYEAEAEPEGNFVMNYACASLHRRGHWLAGVKGHSRYLWGSEIYESNNLYGRYINYGNLQILGSGRPVNNRDSGFSQEGWDWNCFPGTTAVRLPMELLRARVCVVDATAGFEEMLISDETFAGGISMDKRQGAFGLILHGHGKYDGSFRARKSWFFFDDRIICLGSAIEGGDEEHEVITTLFQTCLTEEHRVTYLGTEAIRGLSEACRYDGMTEEAVWLTDPCGNRYRIPEGHHVVLKQSMQKSKAQDTGEDTVGPFSKAWLVHGKAPVDGGYEYMIQVMPRTEQAKELLDRASDWAHDRMHDPMPDRVSDPEHDPAPDRVSDRAHDPAPDRAHDPAPDRAPDRASDPSHDPAHDRASDPAHNPSHDPAPYPAPYRVLERSRRLHAVTDPALGMTGYVFFESCETEPDGNRRVKSVSMPCLVMERLDGQKLTLSVCDPDLRFYAGTEADQRNPDGSQKEVSLYSRTWRMSESMVSVVRVRLAGLFETEQAMDGVRLIREKDETVVEVRCKGGRVTQMCLISVPIA